MKKFYVFVLFLFVILLSGCGKQTNDFDKNVFSGCEKPFTVSVQDGQNFLLKARVVTNDQKIVLSDKAGIITYLNCENGQKINKGDLLVEISPDFGDPNVQNLMTQQSSLISQISNLQQIIDSTRKNFDFQLQSLNQQKQNLEQQIPILEKNIENLKNQQKFGVSDLISSYKTLEQQLQDLNKQKQTLESLKSGDLGKLYSSLENLSDQIFSFLDTVLKKIDEIYGVTPENQLNNDRFENYLGVGVQGEASTDSIKTKFFYFRNKISALKNLSGEQKFVELSNMLADFHDYLVNIKTNIKHSLDGIFFPQAQIDAFYSAFDQFDNNLLSLKSNLDNLQKSLSLTKDNYDSKIISLETQINSVQNNLQNLKDNKINSYISSLDVQINNLLSQLNTTKTNLESINQQINSLSSQEVIQINQLKNQLKTLQASLKNIEVNLSPQQIFSNITGIVKNKFVSKGNKVGPGTKICMITPNNQVYKFQIYSPVKLSLGTKVLFDQDGEYNLLEQKSSGQKLLLKIQTQLPYKDPISQNYIYETEQFFYTGLQEQSIVNVNVLLNSGVKSEGEQKVKIPLDYLESKINGYFVEQFLGDKKISKRVVIGNVDGSFVEILSGLNFGDIICKK